MMLLTSRSLEVGYPRSTARSNRTSNKHLLVSIIPNHQKTHTAVSVHPCFRRQKHSENKRILGSPSSDPLPECPTPSRCPHRGRRRPSLADVQMPARHPPLLLRRPRLVPPPAALPPPRASGPPAVFCPPEEDHTKNRGRWWSARSYFTVNCRVLSCQGARRQATGGAGAAVVQHRQRLSAATNHRTEVNRASRQRITPVVRCLASLPRSVPPQVWCLFVEVVQPGRIPHTHTHMYWNSLSMVHVYCCALVGGGNLQTNCTSEQNHCFCLLNTEKDQRSRFRRPSRVA